MFSARPLTSTTSSGPVTSVAGGVAAVFLIGLVVWPLVAVLSRSLAGAGPGEILSVLGRGSVRSVVVFTATQALVSTAATVLLGLPLAYCLAKLRFPGRQLLRAAVVVPFVLPTVVVAAAIDTTFDAVDLDMPLAAIVYAHVFFNLAVVVRVVSGYWATIDSRQQEAARMLGASPWVAWRTITLRQLTPALLASASIVFLFSFTSFGVIRILGGLRRATLETEIYRYAVTRAEFDVAAVLALLQLGVVLTLAVTSARLQRRASKGGWLVDRPQSVDSMARRLLLAASVAVVLLVQAVPAVLMVGQSLRVGDGFGLDHYLGLFERADVLPVSAAEAVANSLLFAAAAALIAAAVGVAASSAIVAGGVVGRWLETLNLVPLGVSAVTLGFGYLVGFAAFDLRQSIWLVPLSHAVIGIPFVVAAVVPAMRSVGLRVRQAAAVLGASPSVVWRTLDWPVTRRAATTGAGFAAAVSLGEFGATSFLARGQQSFTAPLAVFRLLSTPGQSLRGQALALSVVMGASVAIVAAALERARFGSADGRGGLL